ncbi:MAG: ParB N-terminal domain-containing protein [Flavobacteriales bacterium]|nr:ParB N-terminal domain-containing protein [Flavobacteriales bacterium]
MKGKGNSINYKYRMHDPRIGRFFALDPLKEQYPYWTPYAFSGNRVINAIELEGLEPFVLGGLFSWNTHRLKTTAQKAADIMNKNPNMSSTEAILRANLDDIHVALDVAGAVPVVGEIFDGINALIYTFEGDHVNAGISAAAMIPIIGEGSKISKYVIKYGDEVVSGLKSADELYTGGRVYKSFDKAKMFLYNLQEFGEKAANLYADGILTSHAQARQFSKLCGCFVSETDILTEDGVKKIEEIQVGDLVWSYNVDTKENELKEVVKVFVKETDEVFRIYIDSVLIDVTGNHPFFVSGEWYEVYKLQSGDTLRSYKGENLIIDSIVNHTGHYRVYNFEVEGNHNYYASNKDILVHNLNCGFFSVKNDYGKSIFRLEPRKYSDIDLAKIDKAKDRIQKGLEIDPIRVYKKDGEMFIIDGHHTFDAYKDLGRDSIPMVEVSKSEWNHYLDAAKKSEFAATSGGKRLTSSD